MQQINKRVKKQTFFLRSVEQLAQVRAKNSLLVLVRLAVVLLAQYARFRLHTWLLDTNLIKFNVVADRSAIQVYKQHVLSIVTLYNFSSIEL